MKKTHTLNRYLAANGRDMISKESFSGSIEYLEAKILTDFYIAENKQENRVLLSHDTIKSLFKKKWAFSVLFHVELAFLLKLVRHV